MSKPLRVLIVEDSEDDALLLVQELRRGGYEPTFVQVATPEAMSAALADQAWDIIISDYSMPHFNGLAAFSLLRESGLDIPFIIASGTIGEETAVAAMKAGAHDYLMKDNLKRLGPAVERELRETGVRRERTWAAQERSRLFDEVQRNLKRIRALHEIDTAITSALDLQTVLGVLLEKIDLFLSYSAATVRLFNKESGLLEPVACRNLDESEWKAEMWRAGRGMPNLVFENKAPLMVLNVQADPRSRDVEFFRKHALVSYLGIPLIAKRETLGVLGLYTKEQHQFSDEEVEFLTTLAGQAAVAIHNSLLYEEIKKQAQELEKANRVKSEFLSVMSHELRTPLTAVMGYTGLVKDGMFGEIKPEQEKALKKALQRSADLLSMINGILHATTFDSGNVTVETQQVDLNQFLKALSSDYETPLKKDLRLIWNFPLDLPTVRTDGEKLKHILQNLVNNAAKFTEKGSVTVSARITQDGSRQKTGSNDRESEIQPAADCPPPTRGSWIEFKVTDTGIGIPPEKIPLIFDMFRQVDSSETRLYGGVGLGLYIVKKFTELLGGTVDVKSEPERGATFTVKIPFD